ncbi:Regulator of chromosome condensation (RCC1) repeat protein [Legionella cherrii]|uniref:Regulator of chromosome condensation (RCC1) repeat protein n=1 Tax=Legionella cherrii TaxID=28084 RepID=A0A0W0S8F6_9GAMM|nr:F-box-like domain-containing protein [Legionella cherrii]KTC79377.1 Regulator of chromosome condensation (RCC1) repeat protein [Legionella cherrii]
MGESRLEVDLQQLTTLPEEVLFQVLDNLTITEIIKLKKVSKAIKKLASDYLFEELKIKEVHCGQDFTLILLNHGRVLAIGSNLRGQLGLGQDIKQVSELTEITAFRERVTHIATGFTHAIFLGESGKVYGLGRNEEKQIAPDSDALSIYVPTPIEVQATVKNVFAQDHTSALIFTGDSPDKAFKIIGNPLKAYALKHIKVFLSDWLATPSSDLEVADIAVNNQQQCALLLTTNGEVYVYGNNESGLLGLNPENVLVNTWTKLPYVKAKQIKTTALGCFILTHDNLLLASGSNTKGQLGPIKEFKGFMKIASDVKYFDAADHHTLYVDSQNKLFLLGAMKIDDQELRMVEKGILPIQGSSKPSTEKIRALLNHFFIKQPDYPKPSQDQSNNDFSP